jgi:alkanesulfonate monooxygenase SsuD/methylene tetrahydromethanopterin reductase-like flavin-dependent oxidoreductase (luciferase family)
MELLCGISVSTSAAPGADPAADARRAEELGFDFVSANDHPCGTTPTHEVWTMLAWMAANTSRIGIAPRVLGVPYRPPPMVAKMAETLDRLSGGRLILGLGGGASDEEFHAFGLGVPSPREKIEGLEEAVRIIRGLWSQRDFSFQGRRYRTKAANLEPKPERPIPIWLGTFARRGLALTGRLADGWIPSIYLAPPDRVTRMRDQVFAAAENAGRDPEQITCCYNMEVSIGVRHPRADVLSGSFEELTERLRSFVELGFTAFNFILPEPAHDDQRELLARQVIPALRRA